MLPPEARGYVVFSPGIKGELKEALVSSMIMDMGLCHFQRVLQNNVMVFIAELFWWFESVKPEFVQPRELQEPRDGKMPTSILLTSVAVCRCLMLNVPCL